MGVTHAVPEPVRCGREGDAAGTNWQGENLANDDPGARAPSCGKEKDVDADKGDNRTDGVGVLAIGNADNRDDKLTDNHTQSTPDQKRATAHSLHGPERYRGGTDIDNSGNSGHQEGILDRA
jgi:hypothetical protein